MQIRSTDPSRSQSIEDRDQPSMTTATTARGRVEAAIPDWDRIPTLDVATFSAVHSGTRDENALLPKLEKLQTDLKALHTALAPYGRECKEVHHGLHEIQEAIEMMKEAKHVGFLGPAVVGLAIAKAEHGIRAVAHGFAGMKREAPDAVRNAKPAWTKVVEDIADIKGALTASLERPAVAVRG
jgi:hypothetical protein